MNRVRPATLTDTAMIARIDVECWRSTYAGVLPDKFLLGLSENERRRLWSGYIARHPGDLVVGVTPAGRGSGVRRLRGAPGPPPGLSGRGFSASLCPPFSVSGP